ncbi:MAG: DUF4919 domain-containing protein [Bacteroidota bacterium]|nr:DUF4919 domain-containing protein [Bacteroidota bacterium]
MQKQLAILLTAFGFIASAQNNFNYKNDFKTILTKTKDANDKLCYDKLLSRFESNDSTLSNPEVLALLIGFTARTEYKPYEDLKEENAIYNLNAEGKYDEALQKANEFLKTHPLSVKVIYEKSFSYYKAHYIDSAKFYVKQGQKIFKAMAYSGTGKSKETPMFSLGPTDGQDYIYKYIDGGIGNKGSGQDEDGNFMEILEISLKVGEPYSLFFIIQHAKEKVQKGK